MGSFKRWVGSTFQAALRLYTIKVPDEQMKSVLASMNVVKEFKWDVQNLANRVSINLALSLVHQNTGGRHPNEEDRPAQRAWGACHPPP